MSNRIEAAELQRQLSARLARAAGYLTVKEFRIQVDQGPGYITREPGGTCYLIRLQLGKVTIKIAATNADAERALQTPGGQVAILDRLIRDGIEGALKQTLYG